MKKKLSLLIALSALTLSVGAAVGVGAGVKGAEKTEAYDDNTPWYLSSTINGWTRTNNDYKMVWKKKDGNNDEFALYGVKFNQGDLFNFVNPYQGGENKFRPEVLAGTGTDVDLMSYFTNEDGKDYTTVNQTMTVNLFFQKSRDGNWTRLYWNNASAEEELERWCNDFLESTGDVCKQGNVDDNHQDGLKAYWEDDYYTSSADYYIRGTFNWDSGTPLNKISDDLYAIRMVFNNDTSFKILKDDDYDKGQWPQSGNFFVADSGVYLIVFRPSQNSVTYRHGDYLKVTFDALTPDAKTLFRENTANNITINDAFERYTHVTNRYGLDNFASVATSSSSFSNPIVFDSTNYSAVIILATTVALVAVGGYFLLRKARKED